MVATVIEKPAQAPWVEFIQRLFGSLPPRLIVIYSDTGFAPR